MTDSLHSEHCRVSFAQGETRRMRTLLCYFTINGAEQQPENVITFRGVGSKLACDSFFAYRFMIWTLKQKNMPVKIKKVLRLT